MRNLRVNLEARSYNILIGDNPLETIGVECKTIS